MQDVVPPENDRSIRNIPVSPRYRTRPENHEPAAPQLPKGGRWKGTILWIIAFIIVCAIGAALAFFFFSGTTVTVFPRQATTETPQTLTAGLNAPVGSLAYQLAQVSQSASQTVPADGTQTIDTLAQGTVTIYNDYNTQPQTLVTTTRFEAPNGDVYRIHGQVIVPGGTQNASGTFTPGQVTATVYADEAGPSYNISSSTKFTIPGFEGTARYNGFYAEGSNISGGARGVQPTVSNTDLATVQAALQKKLAAALPSAIAGKIPDDFTVVPGTLEITYSAPTIASSTSADEATVKETAVATEAMVRTNDIANAVARQEVQGYGGEAIGFADPDALSLALASGTPYSTNNTSITFSLASSTTLVWQYNPVKLQNDLAGKSKGDFETVVKTFAPAIAKATASIRPFWETTFPDDPNKIQVKTAPPSGA